MEGRLVNIHAHSQREVCPDAEVQGAMAFEKQIYAGNKISNLCPCLSTPGSSLSHLKKMISSTDGVSIMQLQRNNRQ